MLIYYGIYYSIYIFVLNSLWKSYKMLDKPHTLSLILNLFIKFNNTWAFLLDPLFSHRIDGNRKVNTIDERDKNR